MYSFKVFIGAILMAGMSSALFAAGFDYKVRNDFFAGFAGDQAALERAMKTSAAAIEASPDDAAEALAWHGGGLMFLSGRKFQAGDAKSGVELWSQGVAEMDKAGAIAPNNPAVLIPRAATWFGVSRQSPPEMGRPLLKKALADYEHVYELQKSFFDTLSAHMRGELLFGLADGYARDGNAEKAQLYFEKLAAAGPATGHLEQAQLYLKGSKYQVTGLGCVGCHTGN